MRGPLVSDDAGLEQHLQMPAHRRGGHAHGGRQLASSARFLTKQLHNLAPRRVGQGAEDYGDVRVNWPFLAHRDNS